MSQNTDTITLCRIVCPFKMGADSLLLVFNNQQLKLF